MVKGWLLVFLYETWLGDLLLDWFERLTGLAVVPVEQVALWVDLEVGAARAARQDQGVPCRAVTGGLSRSGGGTAEAPTPRRVKHG